MSYLRLYGRLRGGNDSWACVTRGLWRGLRKAELLREFLETYDTAEETGSGEPEGFYAPLALYVGPPKSAIIMRARGHHGVRAAMVAPNSTWLPTKTLQLLDVAANVLVGPSHFACEVLRQHRPDSVVVRLPHGIDPDAFHSYDRYAPWQAAEFRVLHLTTTAGERKGTDVLVRAWKKARAKLADAKLVIISDAAGVVGIEAEELGRDGIELRPRLNLAPEEMRRLYQSYHIVAQPSRGEGFGMVPLEARTSGVPTLVTACTGHVDHVRDDGGSIIVPTGPDAPIDDGFGALAPSLDVDALAAALVEARRSWDALAGRAQQTAIDYARSWSWERCCQTAWQEHDHELLRLADREKDAAPNQLQLENEGLVVDDDLDGWWSDA